jgi:serine/threonine protein kinase
VLHTLGHGKYAVVKLVRAKQGLLRPLRAAKVIQLDKTRPLEHAAKCRREAELQDRCRSAHVCRVHDAFQDGDEFVILMDFLGGGDLEQVVCCRNPDDHVVGLARALAHCHSLGVVHGDVKTNNALLSASGVVQLVDFGCADECVDATSGCHRSQGTLPYMAPELWTSAEHGSAVDVWAFGVLLYRVWGEDGMFPFPTLAGSFGAPRFLRQYERTPDIERRVSSWRRADLLARMLQVRPALRPSADEVLAEVLAIADE